MSFELKELNLTIHTIPPLNIDKSDNEHEWRAVSNEILCLWKEHYINHFGLKLLSKAGEVVQDGNKWEDSS